VAALVRDSGYLAAVAGHGGGGVAPTAWGRAHPREAQPGIERNPTLWIERLTSAALLRYPGLPFAPIERSPIERLRYAVRKRVATAYAPVREARRDWKLARLRRRKADQRA